MTIQIKIDHSRCLGAGVCSYTAPNTFSHDESGRAKVVDTTGDAEELIRRAHQYCPNEAIILMVDGVELPLSDE